MLVVECNACGAAKRFPVGMEVKKGAEWRLWCERPDVVIGGEKGGGEGGQKKDQEPIDPKTERPLQQSSGDAVAVDVTT